MNPSVEQVRIDLADIVIVNWDAANGDYACGSDHVYQYFVTRSDRRTALLVNEGILLCEFQSGKGVLHQGAYDVIFGKEEVTVFEAQLGQARKPARNETTRKQQEQNEATSRGAHVRKFRSCFNYCRNHPLTKALEDVLGSEFVDDGDHIFNFSDKFAEFQRYKDRNDQLWRGWFAKWQREWVPLLVAIPVSEPTESELDRGGSLRKKLFTAITNWGKSLYKRWFRLPQAVLLAKVQGKGLMLASTMWIAGARCQALVDQIVKPNIVQEIRTKHRRILLTRRIVDVFWLSVIEAGYLCLLMRYHGSEATALGKLLGDVGFTWLLIISGRVWKHFFWNRPFGANFFQFFRFAGKSFWETI